jgi:hypothetical protein
MQFLYICNLDTHAAIFCILPFVLQRSFDVHFTPRHAKVNHYYSLLVRCDLLVNILLFVMPKLGASVYGLLRTGLKMA